MSRDGYLISVVTLWFFMPYGVCMTYLTYTSRETYWCYMAHMSHLAHRRHYIFGTPAFLRVWSESSRNRLLPNRSSICFVEAIAG